MMLLTEDKTVVMLLRPPRSKWYLLGRDQHGAEDR